jgi:hypothetical protein
MVDLLVMELGVYPSPRNHVGLVYTGDLSLGDDDLSSV